MTTYLKVGFTGTRNGMTEVQKRLVKAFLRHWSCQEGHHGLCIGADAEFHKICQELEIKIVGHPPYVKAKMAVLDGFSFMHKDKSYMDRNRDIAAAGDVLLAVPPAQAERKRSGTWSTVRMARQMLKPAVIIFPDGSTVFER